MIPVIDLGRNNTPAVRFSFAGFVHVSRSDTRASVPRSYLHNAYQSHVKIMYRHTSCPTSSGDLYRTTGM